MFLRDDINTYRCDSCGKAFRGHEAKLVAWPKNKPIYSGDSYEDYVKYVDKLGRICADSKVFPNREGDQLVACPHCGHIHKYGFLISQK